MHVTMTYRIPKVDATEPGHLGEPLEDTLNWPDVTDEAKLPPLVAGHLDAKYGAGGYVLDDIAVKA